MASKSKGTSSYSFGGSAASQNTPTGQVVGGYVGTANGQPSLAPASEELTL